MLTKFLAVWGALLSTLVAGMTFADLWKHRFRIATTYAFADSTRGNQILITNLSGQPITLVYWNLLWLARRWPKPKQSRVPISQDEELPCVVIESGHTHRLFFEGPNYFDWGDNAIGDDTIYLQLYFAGRRARLKRIYGKRDSRR